MLQLARERKGVDLFRAERDTKIRLKYLAALEDSDFEELPAPVYTKGFLRNYAIYLALDPEEVLQRWRDEMIQARGRKAERPALAPPPRPIVAPRRGVTVSVGWLMTLLVLAAVLGFVGFIGMQLMRFAETPAVSLTDPPSLVSVVNAEKMVLAGTSGAGAVISINGPGGQLLTTNADQTGYWSMEVPLAPGRNDFTVAAMDPVTHRASEPLNVIVSVPLGLQSPSPSPGETAAGQLRLTLSSPLEGASLEASQLTVSGTTSGGRVTIAASLVEPPPQAPPDVASPDPDTSPAPSGQSHDVSVVGGSFSQPLDLTPGRWEIVVTAYSSGLQPISQRRTVNVTQPDEIVLLIEATRGDSWLRIVTDGSVMRGWGGPTLRRGASVTVTAESEIWLRTGNAGALRITLNGAELGVLGRNGQVANWIIRPGTEPERTTESR